LLNHDRRCRLKLKSTEQQRVLSDGTEMPSVDGTEADFITARKCVAALQPLATTP